MAGVVGCRTSDPHLIELYEICFDPRRSLLPLAARAEAVSGKRSTMDV
jgi:hypothetical protein